MAVPAIQLFAHAKSAVHLFEMIEGDKLSSSLGDIEMRAARTAFQEVPRALDKRGQVWTCIGHLNSAQAAYETFILSRTPGNVTGTRSTADDIAGTKRKYVLAVKAICYKYLGEENLCSEALTLAKADFKKSFWSDGALGATYAVVGLLSTAAIWEALYNVVVLNTAEREKEYQIDEDTRKNLESILR